MNNKSCPKCETPHDKPGIFCSRSCANGRIKTAEQKLKTSISCKAFYKTEAGKVAKASTSGKIKTHWENGVYSFRETPEFKQFLSENRKSHWTEDKRKRLSERMKNHEVLASTREKLREAAIKREFGGHTSKIKIRYFNSYENKEVYLQSSYEVAVAEILDVNCIKWTRPPYLKWVSNKNTEHRYYPDFYLPEFDCYLDPKNSYLIQKDADKIEQVRKQNNVIVLVLTESQLTWDKILELIKNERS